MTEIREVTVDELKHLVSARAGEGETMLLNMGPQHPSTHGVLRLRLVLDGERVISCEPIVGYMHRGAEKLFEVRDYRQIVVLANRHDWLRREITSTYHSRQNFRTCLSLAELARSAWMSWIAAPACTVTAVGDAGAAEPVRMPSSVCISARAARARGTLVARLLLRPCGDPVRLAAEPLVLAHAHRTARADLVRARSRCADQSAALGSVQPHHQHGLRPAPSRPATLCGKARELYRSNKRNQRTANGFHRACTGLIHWRSG